MSLVSLLTRNVTPILVVAMACSAATCVAQSIKHDALSREFFETYGNDFLLHQVIREPIVLRELDLTDSQRGQVSKCVRDYLNCIDDIYSCGIDVFWGKHGFDHETPEGIVEDKRTELGLQAWNELYDGLTHVLEKRQIKRLSEVLVQINMFSSEPLGMYMHDRLGELVNLSSTEKAKVAGAVKENQKEFYEELLKLQKDYHRRIRESLSMTVAEKLEAVIGDPVIVPQPFQLLNQGRFNAEITKVLSRPFVDKTGARISTILADPWLSRELNLTSEQKKQIDELNLETTKRLTKVNYGDVQKELYKKREVAGDKSDLTSEFVLEQYELCLDAVYRQYYQEMGNVLLPPQIDRLRQVMLQIGLNKPAPFGIFVSNHFTKLFGLNAKQKKRLKEAIKLYASDYFEKADVIRIKYHRRIRKEFRIENTNRLNYLLGKPFEYLKLGYQ